MIAYGEHSLKAFLLAEISVLRIIVSRGGRGVSFNRGKLDAYETILDELMRSQEVEITLEYNAGNGEPIGGYLVGRSGS